MVSKTPDKLIDALMKVGLLKDRRLIRAFREVSLEEFIPLELQDPQLLYEDMPLPFYMRGTYIRTISAPHMICIMLQSLGLKSGDSLLILGAKSGYIAALATYMAQLGEIFIVEANEDIVNLTRANLEKTGFDKTVSVHHSSPIEGLPKLAPWQRIMVTGQITEQTLYQLLDQLDTEGGLLFAPVGVEEIQEFLQVMRQGDEFYGKMLGSVVFGPLQVDVTFAERPPMQIDLAKLFEADQRSTPTGEPSGDPTPVSIVPDSQRVDAEVSGSAGAYQTESRSLDEEVPLEQIVATAVQEALQSGGVVKIIRLCEILDVPFERVTTALQTYTEGHIYDKGPNPLQDKVFVVPPTDPDSLQEALTDLKALREAVRQLKFETEFTARASALQEADTTIDILGSRENSFGIRLKKLKAIFLKISALEKVQRQLEERSLNGTVGDYIDQSVALAEQEGVLLDDFLAVVREDLKTVAYIAAWTAGDPAPL